jgi:hypothetical protein
MAAGFASAALTAPALAKSTKSTSVAAAVAIVRRQHARARRQHLQAQRYRAHARSRYHRTGAAFQVGQCVAEQIARGVAGT